MKKAISRINFPDKTDTYQDVITDIFKQLARYQEEELDKLKKEVKTEEIRKNTKENNNQWHIIFRTISEQEQTGETLYPLDTECCIKENLKIEYSEYDIKEEKKHPIWHDIFLRCKYEEIKNYLHKAFNGQIRYKDDNEWQSIRYELVRNNRMIEKFKKMNKIAALYQWEIPPIFVPDIYHAVDIHILEGTINWDRFCDVGVEFNFAPKNNGFSRDLIESEKKIYWNVEEKEMNDTPVGGQIPNDGIIEYRYFYRDGIGELDFIFPEYDFETIAKIPIDNTYQIKVTRKERIISPDSTLYRIKPIPNGKKTLEKQVKQIHRIHSKGDVAYALSCAAQLSELKDAVFNTELGEKFSCKYHGLKKSEKATIIQEHEGEHCEPFGKRPLCYIEFQGPDIYLCDYANFIRKYLAEHYPDFQWVGVHV